LDIFCNLDIGYIGYIGYKVLLIINELVQVRLVNDELSILIHGHKHIIIVQEFGIGEFVIISVELFESALGKHFFLIKRSIRIKCPILIEHSIFIIEEHILIVLLAVEFIVHIIPIIVRIVIIIIGVPHIKSPHHAVHVHVPTVVIIHVVVIHVVIHVISIIIIIVIIIVSIIVRRSTRSR